MKRVRYALLVFCACFLTAVAQQQAPLANDSPPRATSPKTSVTAPKVIDSPDPAETFDPGKGPTVLRVIVGSDGKVLEAKVAKSSGSERADANALAAVKKWRFKPATKDGVPVEVMINVQLDARHP